MQCSSDLIIQICATLDMMGLLDDLRDQREKCQIRSFFWSEYSCIQTEYEDLLRISPYSVQMQEIRTKNNSLFGHYSRSAVTAYLKHERKNGRNQILI